MAKSTKKQEQAAPITRAEKKDATKNLIKQLLEKKDYKHNELIDEVSKTYSEKFGGEETDNINDVKGRVGSVLDILKKDGEVVYEGGVYALKKEQAKQNEAEKPTKRVRKTAVKEEKTEKEEKRAEKKATEKKQPKAKAIKGKEKKEEEEIMPLPTPPLQPIAPVAPVTPEVAPEPIPKQEPTPKKRGRKPKEKVEEAPVERKKVEEIPAKEEEEKEQTLPEAKEEKEEKPIVEEVKTPSKGVVMDMSFLFGSPKPVKGTKAPEKAEEKLEVEAEESIVSEKKEEKSLPTPQPIPQPKKEGNAEKTQPKVEARIEPNRQEKKPLTVRKVSVVKNGKPKTAEEKLQEAFLKRLHRLGGEYFEYYSIYLLEKYSRKNGRRLEGLKITGGEHDGGIDGEIELTDRFGFRETIYIQSKNWDPDKGDERLWVVGETLLQQFMGACMCRQAKDGKQNCRGIFITTSRFTPEAKRILQDMSDKFIGYDGAELYETAKECEFGLVKKNGEWVLDETLLSGEKAFFNLF